jgi:hypothetical protein
MILAKYTDNIYSSEVYRELERQAVKKGFFKPTETELVKLAADEVNKVEKINQEVDVTPSNDFIQDVACLAYAMRRKGFVTLAEDLEEKLVIYKKAENELYNVNMEKTKDFIDFAHRDGDVNLIDGSGELGTIETQQGMADKILAVVNKNPTGKYPTNKIAEFAAEIMKKAQEQNASEMPAENQSTYQPDSSAPKNIKESLTRAAVVLNDVESVKNNQPIPVSSFSFNDQIEKKNEVQNAYIYFARLAGVNVNQRNIQAWFILKGTAGDKGVLTDGDVPVISAANLQSAYKNAYSSSFTPSAANGILQSIAAALGVGPTFASKYINETSKYDLFAGGLNMAPNWDNVNAACKELADQASKLYISVWGVNNDTITKATAILQSMPDNLYKKINTIDTKQNFQNNVNKALSDLINISKTISLARNDFTKQPTYNYMKAIVNDIDQIVTWADGIVKHISDSYKTVATPEQRKPFDIDTRELDKAYNYWLIQAQSEDEATKNKATHIADRIQQLKGILDQGQGKIWLEVKDDLEANGISAPTKEALQNSINTIANSAKGGR